MLVLTTGELEDLRIAKLILYLFEGMSGLETNFFKTCLYSTNLGELPNSTAAETLNCKKALLLVTYLCIPISSRRLRRQDWEELISKVRRRLSS